MAEFTQDELDRFVGAATTDLVRRILDDPTPGQIARITAGAGLGAFRALRDRAGLEQSIYYCQLYLAEIENEHNV